MTTRPHLRLGSHLLPGLVAVALFAVMALSILPAGFGPGAGIDTTVANVTVADSESATVEIVQTDKTYAEVTQGNTTTNVTVTDQTGVNTEVVRTGGKTYVVASHGITAGIGRALLDQQHPGHSEGFLAAFEIVDLVLVAALVAAVMLARREIQGEVVTALFSEATDRPEADAATDGGSDDEEGGDD